MNQGLRQTIILGLTKISVISYSYSVFVVDTDSAVQLSNISYANIGRVIWVRSFYFSCFYTVTLLAIQVMPRLVHFFISRLVLNLYTTDYSLYFVNCRRTKKTVRLTVDLANFQTLCKISDP